MNHSWNYYRKLYAHPGKTVFYALRKVKPKQHDAIIAIHAIYREIYAILFKCHEPSVARIRLQWWRDEISKLYAGNAQHVVCQTLHPHLTEYSLNKHLFFDLINALDNFFNDPHFEQDNDVETFLLNTAGKRDQLIAQVINTTWNKDLTLFTETVYHLRHLSKHYQHQCLLLSDHDKQTLHHHLENKQPLTDFIKHSQFNTRLKVKAQQKTLYFSAYASITRALFKKMKTKKFDLFRHYYAISPIRKLMNAQ